MNPKIDLTATNYSHLKTGYIPKPKLKAKSYSVYSNFGDPICVNETYKNCMGAIKKIGYPNNKGLKPVPNY